MALLLIPGNIAAWRPFTAAVWPKQKFQTGKLFFLVENVMAVQHRCYKGDGVFVISYPDLSRFGNGEM